MMQIKTAFISTSSPSTNFYSRQRNCYNSVASASVTTHTSSTRLRHSSFTFDTLSTRHQKRRHSYSLRWIPSTSAAATPPSSPDPEPHNSGSTTSGSGEISSPDENANGAGNETGNGNGNGNSNSNSNGTASEGGYVFEQKLNNSNNGTVKKVTNIDENLPSSQQPEIKNPRDQTSSQPHMKLEQDTEPEPGLDYENLLPLDTSIATDPIKHVPAALIDASGALQIDDGSLTPKPIPILSRRLVKRKDLSTAEAVEVDDKKFSIEKIKQNLKSGFDTSLGSTILLVSLILLWYWSNTAFNVYNKQILNMFQYPFTVTMIQFFIASIVMCFIFVCRNWYQANKKNKAEKLSMATSPTSTSTPNTSSFKNNFSNLLILSRITLPLAVLHASGFLLTNMSLGKVSVAFTHTVKATEPFFSVALTPSILGDVPTWGILISLFPIVAGVIIASATEVSFNWIGFLAAIGSNLALQSRNILSKRLMNSSSSSKTKNKKTKMNVIRDENELKLLEKLDNINLFTLMTTLAFFILLPITLLYEGFPLITFLTSASSTSIASLISSSVGVNVVASSSSMVMNQHLLSKLKLVKLLVVGGVYRCIDVLVSYMILKRVSPVSHSIGNCVKRAIVIIASVFFFNTKMTMLNVIGTSLALFGVFAYSLIVSACKQNSFGPDSPFCRPIYTTEEVELTEGGGI